MNRERVRGNTESRSVHRKIPVGCASGNHFEPGGLIRKYRSASSTERRCDPPARNNRLTQLRDSFLLAGVCAATKPCNSYICCSEFSALFSPTVSSCAALSCAVTRALGRGAVAGLGYFSIGADAGLRVHAPEDAVIGRRNSGIVLSLDELSLPAERGAQVLAVGVESFSVEKHKSVVSCQLSVVGYRFSVVSSRL